MNKDQMTDLCAGTATIRIEALIRVAEAAQMYAKHKMEEESRRLYEDYTVIRTYGEKLLWATKHFLEATEVLHTLRETKTRPKLVILRPPVPPESAFVDPSDTREGS